MVEQPFPEFERADLDGFARSVAARRPAIARGLAAGWPARARWTRPWLAAFFGEHLLPVARVKGDVMDYSAQSGLDRVAMTFARFLDEMASEGRAAWYLSPLVEEHGAALLSDIDELPWCRGAAYRSSRLWVGPRGVTTPIHIEVSDNVLVQLDGTKRVRLYSRWQTPRLYPNPPWSGVPHYSQVNPVAPDLQRFPRFAACRRFSGEIGPGDAVLIPRGWWHEVTSITPSISINFWWASGLAALPPRLAAAYRRWRAVID